MPRYQLRHSIHHGYYAYDTERKAAAMRFGSLAGDRDQHDAACSWIAKANAHPEGGNAMPSYIVIENTPGYLPEEDDPYVTEDLDSARSYLAERVEEYVDHVMEGYDWRGEMPSVSWSEDRTYCYVVDEQREHDLGRVFEVAEEEGA